MMKGSLKMLGFLLGFLFLNLNVSFSSPQSSFSSSVPQLCSHEEAVTLLQFKSSFYVDHSLGFGSCNESKTKSWKEGADCCSWDGVRCDSLTGRVIDLDLSCSQLSGSFPSNNSLFLPKNLQSLNFSYNDFKGSKIPSKIGLFPNLKFLDLSDSGFSGLVPGEISHLSKLVSLDLSYNQLIVETTTFRDLVQNLSQVRELVFEEVNLSSVDPRLFMNLSTSLTTLSLLGCDLRGNFPNNFFHFPNLKLFKLSGSFSVSSPPLKLNLPSSNLSSSLQLLVLYEMHCSRTLLESIGDLKSLEHLILRDCNLAGSIPTSVGNLSKLTLLDLGYNLLNGTIPPWIFTHPQLRIIFLFGNQLEGQISQFQQKSLEELALSNNRLHGSVPSSIANQVNLSYLSLSSNNLSGILELDMFSNLQNLRYLGLSNTSLLFRNGINVNFTLPHLDYLLLSRCGLSKFPNFLRGSANLSYINLSDNKIEGSIPEWMLNIGKDTLQALILSNNHLTSDLKQLPWRNIQFLDLRSNKFRGVLPIPPNGTRFLLVSNNSFTGQISSGICDVDTFEILDLSHNNFSGEIPNCLLRKSSQNLGVLNLQANKFHGNVPSMFAKECGLQNLNLHGNRLEGPLPRSLLNCVNLEVLDVGNNNMKDTFPDWLETLTEFQVLVLRSNKFHGSVSSNAKANSSFSKLRILDLSDNDFGGPLPVQYIENLKAMEDLREDDNSSPYMEVTRGISYRFSVVVTMKGFTIDLENILTIFTSIDLSKNKFVGEIPSIIGKLNSLKGLNLSYNNLDGHIPPSLGNLTNLEWLDLSSNELVGEIPEELASLTQLGTLKLSTNQLVGRIPQGRQFNTFGNDSYQGNDGLCGPPVSETCYGNETPFPSKQPSASLKENDEFWVFSWRVVALGYGCGMIVGLLCGFLMFHMGKPIWFVSLVDFYPYLRRRKMNRARKHIQRRNGLQT